MAPLKLRVLTLNCWGLPLPRPFGSADRKLRINAIAHELSRGLWDIVALEEVWSQDDYRTIRDIVKAVLPNSTYFHSGFIGSGLCLFTRGQITSTFIHRYTLNGYAHHVHRGDWYGGKAVALARIKMQDEWSVSVYITHLHARYSETRDKYCAHRLVQAYELAQFIRETSSNDSDLTLVLGDTNLEPGDIATKLLLSVASLHDAYLDALANGQDPAVEDGCTCGLASNSYTIVTSTLKANRFDYILYKTARSVKAHVERCETTMARISDRPSTSHSDHEAVCAGITFHRDTGDNCKANAIKEVSPKIIEDCIGVIDLAVAHAMFDRRLYGYMALACVTLFALTFPLSAIVPNLGILVTLIQIVDTLGLVFCFCNGAIALKMEINSLKAAKSSMKLYFQRPSRVSENSSSSGFFDVCDRSTPLLKTHKLENSLHAAAVDPGRTGSV